MKIKRLPKVVYVAIKHATSEDWLLAKLSPEDLVEVGDKPRQIGVYKLREIKIVKTVVKET